MQIRRSLILLMALAVFSSSAHAAEPVRGTWYFSWSGIPFAKLWADYRIENDRAHVVAAFKSSGILRIFKPMKTLSIGEVKLNPENAQTLTFHYENKKEGKTTDLAFDERGVLKQRKVEPEDDPTYRPQVPTSELKGVETPASILATLQQRVKQTKASGQKSFSVRFYEGVRLMQVRAELLPEADYEIKEIAHHVQPISLSRTLLAGFTPKEIKRYKEGEPAALLYLDAGNYFPLALEVPVKLGMMKAYWVEEK